MKKKLLLSALLLGMFITSCDKQDNSIAPASSASSEQAQNAASEDESVANFSFTGYWTLHWSWGCGFTYNTTQIYFNIDGTFYDAFGETGRWTAGNNVLLFNFDNRGDYWGGRAIQRQAKVIGVMANFPTRGCFYLTKYYPVNSSEKLPVIKGQTSPSGK